MDESADDGRQGEDGHEVQRDDQGGDGDIQYNFNILYEFISSITLSYIYSDFSSKTEIQ